MNALKQDEERYYRGGTWSHKSQKSIHTKEWIKYLYKIKNAGQKYNLQADHVNIRINTEQDYKAVLEKRKKMSD
jgi:hypothetical protein